MMSDEFLAFCIEKVLAEGKVYSTESFSETLEARHTVDPNSIDWKAAAIDRFQSISEGDDYLLVAIKLIDEDGNNYKGHLNTQWDELFTAFARTRAYRDVEFGRK